MLVSIGAALVYCYGKEPRLQAAVATEVLEADERREEDVLRDVVDVSRPAEKPIGQSRNVAGISLDDCGEGGLVPPVEPLNQPFIIGAISHDYHIRPVSRANLTENCGQGCNFCPVCAISSVQAAWQQVWRLCIVTVSRDAIVIAAVICGVCEPLPAIMSRWTPLKKAAYKGDAAEVMRLVEEGSRAGGELEYGLTPLHWAATRGHKDVAAYLIHGGADVNADRTDAHCFVVGTPLHCAAYMGHIEDAKLLIDRGAQVNFTGIVGYGMVGGTALHEAARGGHRAMAELLIAEGGDVNGKSYRGRMPLHFANNVEVAGALIANGAAVNAGDEDGSPPVNHAARNGNREVAAFLLSNGAEIDACYAAYTKDLTLMKRLAAEGANLDAGGMHGYTALHIAVQRGFTEMTEWLIDNAVDVNALRKHGLTSLHCAVGCGRMNLAEILIGAGADVDARPENGATALHRAAESGDGRAVEFLIGHGADINSRTGKDGLTAVYLAAAKHSAAAVELLVEAGAEVNVSDWRGFTVLHHAVLNAEPNLVELVIAHGGDVNAKTINGEMPLHFAARYGHVRIAEALIAAGADINAKDGYGPAALHYALRCAEARRMVELFIASGADVDATDRSLRTPLHGAANKGNADLCEILLAAGANVNARDSSRCTALQMAQSKKMQEAADLLRKHGGQ